MNTRLRIDLGYLGTNFSGWASQPERRTVQACLEEAVASALGYRPEAVKTVVAGRTDSGVHALRQVCHLDLPESFDEQNLEGLRQRVQVELATDEIVLHEIQFAPAGFDARFSALSRHYEYRIDDSSSISNPLRSAFTHRVPHALDESEMNFLGEQLLGLHDWASFCRAKPEASTIRKLMDFSWSRDHLGSLSASVVGDAFCHSMVRSMVGAAVAVGRFRLSVSDVLVIRDAKKRSSSWTTMPANGLTLLTVNYPEIDQLQNQAIKSRARRDKS